jgi:hypothetical protein
MLRHLYPKLTDEQLKRARENLERCLESTLRIDTNAGKPRYYVYESR